MKDDLRHRPEYIEELVRELRAKPRDAELWANVAELLSEIGQFEKAVRAYDLALVFDPQLNRALLGRFIALDVCDTDMSEREPPSLRTLVWETLQALEALVRDLRDGHASPFVDVPEMRARKEMRRRLARNPNDADAVFLQSALLAREGAFEEAIALLDQLVVPGVDYPGAREFRNQLQELVGSDGGGSRPGT